MHPAPPQAAVFRTLRARQLRNGLGSMLAAANGRVRLASLLGTTFAVAGFVFLLSLFAFNELFRLKIPVKGMIVGGLFDLLFFTLMAMLLVSAGIILYASLFTSPEAKFLLTTPATADRIFAAKFQAAVGFSSWGFLMLGMPILVAYGIVAGVPWYFYPLLPVFLVGFVLMPGALSAAACLLLVRFLPRNRTQVLVLGGAVATVLLLFWGYRTVMSLRSTLQNSGSFGAAQRDELDGFIGQFALARHPAVPSHWMTTGLLAAARGDLAEAAVPLAMLWSNGLVAFVLAAFLAKRIYRPAFDRVAGHGGTNRGKAKYRGHALDWGMEKLVFYLDRPTRILIVKDFRTFRRDPTQWVLLVIFSVMIAVGAANFRQYYNADLDRLDKYIVGLVNFSGTAVLLCAGLSRFVFPLVSLEGRKFWILGLMPVTRSQILRGKFAFAATGAVLIAEGLVLGSDVLLAMPVPGLLLHGLGALCLALGLAGLNVGLGAYMPNFRETDPSKIVAGFSGTVNMAVNLAYAVVTVICFAAPLHAAATVRHFAGKPGAELPVWIYAGVPVGLAVTAAAVLLPMRAGAKSLRETEF